MNKLFKFFLIGLGGLFVLVVIVITFFLFVVSYNFRVDHPIGMNGETFNFSIKIETEKEALLYSKAIGFYPIEEMKRMEESLRHREDLEVIWGSSAKKDTTNSNFWEIKYQSNVIPRTRCIGKISDKGNIIETLSCKVNK